MGWSRDELERAFADYQAAGAEAGRTGDWSKWPDIFTEDCEYIEHMYGTFHGRQAVYDWIMETMHQSPNDEMTSFPIEWYVIDEERGWVICSVLNRMDDPGDGTVHEEANWTKLHYAGNGLFDYEEDMYNPNDFGEMIKGWLEAKQAAGAKK